jgi:hypothetical protein
MFPEDAASTPKGREPPDSPLSCSAAARRLVRRDDGRSGDHGALNLQPDLSTRGVVLTHEDLLVAHQQVYLLS